MQDETSAWLYLKKRRCSLRPTGMLLWLHGMRCSTRLQSLKESTGSKNWLMRCPCFKMSRLGLIKMETPFWRHFNTGSFFGICWEFWHGYTLLKSWEELRVRTELKTQDVRDTRSNLYYHGLAGFLIIIWINKLLFYNHRTQINRFVSQWIMKFPRFLINWWWLWPSFHLHAPNQFLTSNWKLVVEDPRLMVTYCFMFCKFLQYVYAVCFWFPCIQMDDIGGRRKLKPPWFLGKNRHETHLFRNGYPDFYPPWNLKMPSSNPHSRILGSLYSNLLQEKLFGVEYINYILLWTRHKDSTYLEGFVISI